MKITIPDMSMVVLIGPSGSGKSTFAQKHFQKTEVLSSDFLRAMVRDNQNDQSATKDAFEVLHVVLAKRLAAGKVTVVDATNVQPEFRKPLLAIARQFHCLPVAIVFDVPEKTCLERNAQRGDGDRGAHVVRQQIQQMRRSIRALEREGFRHVFMLSSQTDFAEATMDRQPLWNNRKYDSGPFDMIGDVHGCRSELDSLLVRLGYDLNTAEHPERRKVVFLGDLVDRGPDVPGVLRRAMHFVKSGNGLCVLGNHEQKLLRKLRGKDVKMTHGLAESMAQLEQESPAFLNEVVHFLEGLLVHYVLDEGKLVVAHAGLKESMQGRASGAVRAFAMYGETHGETDEFGLPIRYDWAVDYRGRAMVVYGHTPVPHPEWLNHTINIDTGCVFGGHLTALRYPERELISVQAEKTWCTPSKPFLLGEAASAVQTHDGDVADVLHVEDVMGTGPIATRLHQSVTIRPENASVALEAMSRFAVNPKWLIYLPPTMAPSSTAKQDHFLEHPTQAFAFYREQGVFRVVCEEKHMGSRAVMIVCRDPSVARRRFGIAEEVSGTCYTRMGRSFFDDAAMEAELISRTRAAVDRAGLWDKLGTDWMCLDCELMPWSVKAQELLRTQYAAVGAASRPALAESISALVQASQRGLDVDTLLSRTRERAQLAEQYVEAYRRYCWPVQSMDDIRLAPFHLLASEGQVHVDKSHLWHMETLSTLVDASDPLFVATRHCVLDLSDPHAESWGVQWWEDLTSRGGEGMVVKPFDFVVSGPKGLLQPAIKCRGVEYLRMIYGPEYTRPENLERLRTRGLSMKRSLALREFALGIEALERFVRKEPLRRVHACVFGVLALESEPVDPRL